MGNQPRGPPEMTRFSPISLLSSRIVVLVLILMGFWFGVMFSHQLLGQMSEKTECPCRNGGKETTKEEAKPDFISKKSHQIADNVKESANSIQKVIYLYDSPDWRAEDLWKPIDWQQKCHRSDCVMANQQQLLQKSSVVVVNSLSVASDTALRHLKDRMDRNSFESIKFAFFSGVTPLETAFNPSKYNGIFDLTITYKSNSDIQLSAWPTTGILPAQLRLRDPKRKTTSVNVNKIAPKPGKFDKHFFGRSGKEQFMAYVVTKCDDALYGNRFVMKLRDEGLIHIFTTQENCTKVLTEPELLPCRDVYSDECVKTLEKFKFVVIAGDNNCEDYLPKDYWYALTAWEAVPVMFSTGDCTKMGIPGSCIDALENEYISPTFKEAYAANLDVQKYKNFFQWTDENLLEEFHWQCELCEKLHENTDDPDKSVPFGEFWDKEKNCGKSVHRNELMRAQLVRVGAISG